MEMPTPDATVIAGRDQLIAQLRAALPERSVIDDAIGLRAYECDALTVYSCPPMAVVLAHSTEDVATALRICHASGVPAVPRGAGTSLTGGAMPTRDCVVISVAKMTRVLEISAPDRLIRVEAGRTNLAVSSAVEDLGFFYAPDPSSQLACAISGNIAMNSGGAHCLKYGVTTNNLLGVTLVQMDGTVVEIGGGHMDAGDLDLLAVVCGSEGQLGIVTEATLRILPRPEGARPCMIAFDSAEAAGKCVAAIIKAGLLPVAIEYMDRPSLVACENFAHAGYPVADSLLIVEVEGSDPEIDHQLDLIADIARQFDPVEIRESRSTEESARIWLGRKSAFGAMGQMGDYMCLDGTIPVSALPEALVGIAELADHHGLQVANVFHAGDGNMHPLIVFNANLPGDLARCEALGADILRLCVKLGGCLSGEHGVGIEKRDLMVDQFDPDDLEAQMRVKDVFDPKWLLNPAKVFPLASTEARRCA